MLIACGVIASAPACSRLMSSRFSTSRESRSSDSSTVASSSSLSAGLNTTSGLRRPLTAALADASGVRRSWLTALSSAVRSRSTSASGPAAAACSASRSWRSATAACVGEGLGQPPVGGGQRMAVQHQGQLGVDQDLGIPVGRGPAHRLTDRTGHAPGVLVVEDVRARGCVRALQQRDAAEPQGLPEPVEQGRQRPRASQDAAGEGGQRLRLGARARRLSGTPRGQVDGDAHRDRDGQEDEQGEHVVPGGDGEPVDAAA